MRFSGFDTRNPPSTTYAVDNGLTIKVVDAALGHVTVTGSLKRRALREQFYRDTIRYGDDRADASEEMKRTHAETLLADALTYQQQIETQMRTLRQAVSSEVEPSYAVSAVRTNRESELRQTHRNDDSLYVFHVTAQYDGRRFRAYVGDSALSSPTRASVRPFRLRTKGEMRARDVEKGALVETIHASVRQWEDQF